MHKAGFRAVAAADAAQLTIAPIDEPAEAFFISSSVRDQGHRQRCCRRQTIRSNQSTRPEYFEGCAKTAKESKQFRLQGMEVRQQILDLLLGQDIAETAHLATP